jgi:ribose transport system substrate-binding protein
MGQLAFKALYAAVTNPGAPKAQFVDVDTPQVTKASLAQCVPEW